MAVLAEALTERKEVMRRISEAPERIVRQATWDEDQPKPDRKETDGEMDHLAADINRLQELNVAIHRTNNVALIEEGMTIMQAIAVRDRLNLEVSTFDKLLRHLEESIKGDRRYGFERRKKDDVRVHSHLDPRDIVRQRDAKAAEMRRLDIAIQKVNWSVDLTE